MNFPLFHHRVCASDAADELLVRKEVTGMKLHLGFKVALLVYLLFSELFLETHGLQDYKLSALYIVLLGVEFYFFRWLNCKKNLTAIGFFSLLVDMVLITALPFAWYHLAGGDGVSRAYLLKTSMPLVAIGLILASGFALRPLYPLLLSLGAFGVTVALYFWAAQDPRMVLSNDFEASMLGPAIHPSLYWITSFSLVLIGGVVSFFALTARNTVLEAVQLDRANQQLGRYFSPKVASAIAGSANSLLKPGGKRQKVAVMFCDLRDFTGFSENRSPEEVVAFLSDYHERMVKVIFEHGGTLDKFLGDGILATFGTPEAGESDLSRAVECGLSMKKALAELNAQRVTAGLEPVGQGIGIHYGEAIVGNIGSSERLEYTVIGDTVNQASRIESACKTLGVDFLVSQTVKDGLVDLYPFKAMGEVEVKGKLAPLSLFTFESALFAGV